MTINSDCEERSHSSKEGTGRHFDYRCFSEYVLTCVTEPACQFWSSPQPEFERGGPIFHRKTIGADRRFTKNSAWVGRGGTPGTVRSKVDETAKCRRYRKS